MITNSILFRRSEGGVHPALPLLPRACGRATLAVALLLAASLPAEIPEPANVFYGVVALGTTPVTAAQTAVSVEARTTPTGAAIASYRMGSRASVGDYYSLSVNLESGGASLDLTSAQTGDTLYLTVTLSGVVKEQKKVTLGARGLITRLDFGAIDSDHNGLLDPWEMQYFGHLGVDPNADPDHDGRSNLQEMLAGTNPLLGDSPHPADMNPTNNAIAIGEMVAYSLAWKNGQPWPVAPTNIPLSYVTRAGALWKGGEVYHFDTNGSTAPAWWVNGSNISGSTPNLARTSSKTQTKAAETTPALSALPDTYRPGVAFIVTNLVTPATNVTVYAVEDQPPSGWTVTNVSGGGAYDAVHGKVRWGLFFDHNPRQLTYQVTPPVTAQGAVAFVGQASFDGLSTVDIGGQRVTSFNAPTPLQAPSLTAAGAPHFVVRGSSGQSFNLQFSFDLVTWQPLATVPIPPAGLLDYVDPAGIGRTIFYRALPVP